MSSIIETFNDVVIDMIDNLSETCPNSIIATHKSTIINVLNDKKYKNKFMTIFMRDVMPYRKQLESNDESFFLGDEIYNKLIIKKDHMNYVHMVKKMWRTLDQQNKDILFTYMNILIKLVDGYTKHMHNQ